MAPSGVSRAFRTGLAILGVAVLLVEASCARKKIYGEATSSIEVVVGEQFTIMLAANPTTGYSWTVSRQADPTVVAPVDSDYQPDPSSVVGTGGHQRLTYQAVGRGTTTINLDYRRPWESTTTEKSATFTVIVR